MSTQRFMLLLAVLMALALPFSLSLSYVPLTLALLVSLIVVLRKEARYPRDFLLVLLLYVWRAITLMKNGLPLRPLKDLYDKLPYPIFSTLRIGEAGFNVVLGSLAIGSSVVATLGILAYFTGSFRTGWVYTSCRGECELLVRRPTEVRAVVLTDRNRNRFLNGPELSYDAPARVGPGRYVFYSFAGAIVKVRKGDVSLLKGWVGYYEERRFFNFTSFVGFYDHKMHSGAVFGMLVILFLSLGLFYRRIYLLPVLLLLPALILTEAKAYILTALLISAGMLYARVGLIRLFPYTLLWVGVVGPTILLHSPLRPGFLWSLKARENFWRIGAEALPSNALFGVGYDNISAILRPHYLAGEIDNTAHLHSSYLNAAVETGVVGALLVVLVLLYFSWKFLKEARGGEGYAKAYALGVGLSVLLVGLVGLVESNFDTAVLNLTLTFLMGVGEAVVRGRVIQNPG